MVKEVEEKTDFRIDDKVIVETRETSGITARSGQLPSDLVEKTKADPEALREAGIRSLAKAVSRELLEDPKLRSRFEDVVEQRLKDRVRAGHDLPAVKVRDSRDQDRTEREPREVEMTH